MKLIISFFFVLFLSGCATMDVLSSLNTVNNFIEEIKKPKPQLPSKVVAEGAYDEEKFYDSSHNWNNTKSTKVEKIKISPEPTRKEVKKTEQETEVENQWSIPLPLILIVLLSGSMYFINTIRYYRQRNEK